MEVAMNKNSKRHETKHGSENYDIKGEGTITGKLFPQVLLEWIYKLFKKDISQYPPKDISECGYHENDDNESDIVTSNQELIEGSFALVTNRTSCCR